MHLVVEGKDSDGIHYFIVDVMIVLLSWADVAIPKVLHYKLQLNFLLAVIKLP